MQQPTPNCDAGPPMWRPLSPDAHPTVTLRPHPAAMDGGSQPIQSVQDATRSREQVRSIRNAPGARALTTSSAFICACQSRRLEGRSREWLGASDDPKGRYRVGFAKTKICKAAWSSCKSREQRSYNGSSTQQWFLPVDSPDCVAAPSSCDSSGLDSGSINSKPFSYGTVKATWCDYPSIEAQSWQCCKKIKRKSECHNGKIF